MNLRVHLNHFALSFFRKSFFKRGNIVCLLHICGFIRYCFPLHPLPQVEPRIKRGKILGMHTAVRFGCNLPSAHSSHWQDNKVHIKVYNFLNKPFPRRQQWSMPASTPRCSPVTPSTPSNWQWFLQALETGNSPRTAHRRTRCSSTTGVNLCFSQVGHKENLRKEFVSKIRWETFKGWLHRNKWCQICIWLIGFLVESFQVTPCIILSGRQQTPGGRPRI